MKVHVWRHAATPVTLLAALLAPLFVAALASAQVVIPPIAPPKPAAARSANATTIGIGDLSEGVNFALQGAFGDAKNSFNLFKDDWAAVAGEVERQSTDIADMVMDAIAEVQGIVDETPPPPQTRYFPAFRKLADVIEEANSQLALIAPPSSALHIATPDLGQSVVWASQGNLAKAHDEFQQFQDEWSLIKETVRQSLPAGAATIDAATARVQNLIANPANPNPAQSDYFPALQTLQAAVTDANAQLAALAPQSAPQTQGPLTIRVRNLAEAVDNAGDEDLPGARSEFNQFMNDWSSLASAVRQQRGDVADMIDAAIVRVDTIFASANPPKTEYFPALQELQQVVEDANRELAEVGAPIVTPGPASVAGGTPLTIRTADLDEAVEHAQDGNLDGAKSEFGQFSARYAQVKDAVRQRSPALADRIDAAAAAAQRALDENDSYLGALRTLQQAVADANTQLGN
jgi:hypothetical protein